MSNRCTTKDIKMQFGGCNEAEIRDAIDEYLSVFDPPKYYFYNILCRGCGEQLDSLCGTFVYDAVHGEGHCSRCGRKGRSNHYPKDDDGELLFDKGFIIILQYHVDEGEGLNDENDS